MRWQALALMATLAAVPVQTAPPLSIALMIDVTASVTEAMTPFKWDGRGTLDDLNPTGTKPSDSLVDLFLGPVRSGFIGKLSSLDRAVIGSVAQSVLLSPDFSADRAVLEKALRAALDVPRDKRYGPTPLWDALDVAISALAPQSGKRVVILVTDGLSTGNRRSLSFVIDRAVKEKVSIVVVLEAWRLASSPGWAPRDSPDSPWKIMRRSTGRAIDEDVRQLAGRTGGALVTDGDQGERNLRVRLEEALSKIRSLP